jgi:leader peptidase (prepilin peptidase)/N-methyltransferase
MEDLLLRMLPWFWIAMVFLLGAGVGSFLNVCAHRLPYEKSVLWPGSRCPSCFQAIRWYHNLPLFSYWLLRGRCRYCGATFSMRYFLVELFTGVVFAGLFYLEIQRNILDVPYLKGRQFDITHGLIGPFQEPRLWLMFAFHATLVSFLIVASLCDLQHMEIPLSVTITGTVVGLIGAMLFPWPFPNMQVNVTIPEPPIPGLPAPMPKLPHGVYPWPVWYPLPSWLPPGSWQLGLVTGLAGALAGMIVLRAVRFLFGLGRGIEGLGVGDADLMMMAGAFLGWQPILLAFFLGVFPALVFGIVQVIFRGGQEMPFGPSLAIGVILSLFLWPTVGNHYRPLFFNATVMGLGAVLGAVFLLAASFLLRLIRGREAPDPS